MYDVEFSFAAYLAGYSCAVCNDIVLLHESGGRIDAAWQAAAERFRKKYAGRLDAPAPGERIERIGAGVRSERELLLLSQHLRASDVIG
jgi:GT2 family glycosyltransferase